MIDSIICTTAIKRVSYSLTSSRNSSLSFFIYASLIQYFGYTLLVYTFYILHTLHTKPKQNQSRKFKLTKHIYKRKAVPKKTDARISILRSIHSRNYYGQLYVITKKSILRKRESSQRPRTSEFVNKVNWTCARE